MTSLSHVLAISDPQALADDLLTWFGDERRPLPWRTRADLYGIWISEIMLQQTTVQTAIPYWERFMARFPDVATLADAREAEVLEYWAGLGYYSRGRNLHTAARHICQEYDGRLPDNFDGWLSLPGVGPYTAGAIASIGLGERRPALDANARRVIMRWAAVDPEEIASLSAGQRQRMVDELGARLVPDEEPGVWNEALMELGALRCGARRAECGECPVARHCRAALGGWVGAVPPRAAKASALPVWCGLLLVTWRDRALVYPSPVPLLPGNWPDRTAARDDFSTLHGGLWGAPMTAWLDDRDEPAVDPESWLGALSMPASLKVARGQFSKLGEFSHAITRFRLRVSVYHVPLSAGRDLPDTWLGRVTNVVSPPQNGAFFPCREARPPVTALTEKAIHLQLDSLV